jgi:hypothetical protein
VPVKTTEDAKTAFARGVGPGKNDRDAKYADSKELWKSENRNQGKGGLRYAVAHREDNQVGNPPEVLKSS